MSEIRMPENADAYGRAKLLLGNACGFHSAAARIAECGIGSDFPWPPFFANIGYAFELSLKAYVIHRGGSENLCRNQIGHSLARAVDEACARGLLPPSQGVMEVISQIGPYHLGHNFRYMTPIDETLLPDVVETLATTHEHLMTTAVQLYELLP